MSVKVIPRDELKPKGLKGISDQQLEYHFETHYKGYVNKLNEIWEKLATVDRTKANQNFSDYRALKVEETFNYMGVVLHELYFENLKGSGGNQEDHTEDTKLRHRALLGAGRRRVPDTRARTRRLRARCAG